LTSNGIFIIFIGKDISPFLKASFTYAIVKWHRNRITAVVKVETNYIDSIAASLKGKSCVTSDHVCRNLQADVVGFIGIVIMCSMLH